MRNKTKFPIYFPVIVGHIIMLVLLAIVAMSAVSGFNQIAKSNAIALERRRQMADIRTLQLLIKSMNINQINYINDGDPVDSQAFNNAIAPLLEFREKIYTTIETEDDRLNMNIIVRQTDQYIALFLEKIIPSRENNDTETLQMLKDESDELISQIDPFIQNMIAAYEKKAQEAFLHTQNTQNVTVTLVLILSILAGMISIASGFASAHIISKNTEQIIITSNQLLLSETAMKESERFLNSIIEHIPNMVFVKDTSDFHFIHINRTGEEIIGLEPGSSLGKSDYDFFPKDMADFYRKKDEEVLTLKQLLDIPEELVQTKDLGVRIFHTKKIPILDEKGNVKYILGISEDITERKHAVDQVRQLNAELEERVEKRTAQLEATNKELEAFSYSISHDLRAPLRAINGFSQIILEEYGTSLSNDANHYFNLISKNSIIMGQLVDDLLNFSRIGRQALNITTINPMLIVQDVIDDMQSEISDRKISFQMNQLPDCKADLVLLKQVFVNLISNAVKFTKDQAESYIEIGYTFATPPKKENETPQETHCYYVRDNGVGFDMKYYDKLFGVFQRLHRAEDYEGTGVGLAFVSSIITKHGGRVWADSTPGQGACFYFTLDEMGTN